MPYAISGMADRFDSNTAGLNAPATRHELADHSSGDHEFADLPREILVIGAGALRVRLADSDADLVLNLPANTFQRFPWRVSHVRQATAAGVAVIGFS